MADGVAITAGAGTTVATDDTASGHIQLFKQAYSADGDATMITANANGLLVQLGTTAGTNPVKVEDAAHASGDAGIGVLSVRTDTAAPLAGTTGDYQPLITDVLGKLWVRPEGGAAQDAAITGSPIPIGMRASATATVPTAMSATGDVVYPWADLSGAQVVIGQGRIVEIQGIAVAMSTTPDYSSGDQMGTAITFTGVALASGRACTILSATALDRSGQAAAIPFELLLFRATPTLASSDNAALSLTAANANTARFLGKIVFNAGEATLGTSCIMLPGEVVRGPIHVVTSGSANIFGVLVARGAFNAAATTDIEIQLQVQQH